MGARRSHRAAAYHRHTLLGWSVVTSLLLAPMSTPVHADDVILSNGKSVTGVIVYDAPDSDTLEIEIDLGVITLLRSEVRATRKGVTALSRLKEALAPVGRNEWKKRLALGLWAEKYKLENRALWLMVDALEMQPTHPQARSRCDVKCQRFVSNGYIRVDGTFMSLHEARTQEKKRLGSKAPVDPQKFRETDYLDIDKIGRQSPRSGKNAGAPSRRRAGEKTNRSLRKFENKKSRDQCSRTCWSQHRPGTRGMRKCLEGCKKRFR